MLAGDSQYDSTWAESEEETEPESTVAAAPRPREKGLQLRNAKNRQETELRPAERRNHPKCDMPSRSRNWRAAKDLQRYRHGYPDLDDKVRNHDNTNFKFYMNEKPSQPDEWTIEEMITNWRGKYDQLERNHSYIQWLFPLREPGMNWYAKELTKREIELFKESSVAKRRLIEAYKMMLDFYGIKLVNVKTGAVKRANHWKQRFSNLNLRMHNNLRITRILKCLGEMGFEHYQPPLVKFFLTETLIHNQLPSVRESVLDYFLYTIRNKFERRKLIVFAQMHYKPSSEFVWGPPKGMESRVSHLLKVLQKEGEETVTEDSSDEDTLAKDEESNSLPPETDEGSSSKQRRLTDQSSSDSREKSTNCVKDTKEGSEDHTETQKPDESTSQEEDSDRAKSDPDEKFPVPENNQKGNIEKQAECAGGDVTESAIPGDIIRGDVGTEGVGTEGVGTEGVVMESQNMEELVQVPNCPTKHEEIEADLKIQEDTSEGTHGEGKESKEELLSSGEAEPLTNEDQPVTEGKAVNKTTEEADELQRGITEAANPAMEESNTGEPATREPNEMVQPQPLATREDKQATGESTTGNITKEDLDEVAASELVATEKNKSAKEEGKIRVMEIEQSNESTEPEVQEGQSKPDSERKVPSPAGDESERVEEMETQEVGVGYPMKDPEGKGVEMETEANKLGGEGEDMQMEDGQ
ncbi:uncharacterized protein LOC144508663 isoform X2 [Mustelus asterias]